MEMIDNGGFVHGKSLQSIHRFIASASLKYSHTFHSRRPAREFGYL